LREGIRLFYRGRARNLAPVRLTDERAIELS
jgi:hypothetical protein